MRSYLIMSLMMAAALTYGCSDPSANKSKATVTNAQAESNNTKPASTEKLAISPDNSKIEFLASKVTRSHQGSFKQFSGSIDLTPNDITASQVKIDIETSSVVTDEDDLTKHLQSADFFDVAKFPKATFSSTKIASTNQAGSTYEITGNFDLHGVKKSITFPADIKVDADSVAVSAEFSINRKDFGIVYAGKADDLIRDGVVIKLTVKAPRKKQ
jgi:polyisoprenoid-binding protein YceI